MWMYNLALPTTVFIYLQELKRIMTQLGLHTDLATGGTHKRTEIRMEKMTKAGAKRAKCKYTKRKTSYWEEGIETLRQLRPRIGITQQTDSPILR